MSIDKVGINLQELLLCITSAQDLINPVLVNHHQQVAYLSFKIAEQLDYPLKEQKEVFLAGLVHDIGALSEDERLEVIDNEPSCINVHAFNGARLLEEFKPLRRIADLVRYHHIPWNCGDGLSFMGKDVSIKSHIVHLADRTCVQIKSKRNVLSQLPAVLDALNKDSGTLFEPSSIEALNSLSKKEYIWLDLISDAPVRRLPRTLFDTVMLGIDDIIDLSMVFSHIIDFRSKFTAHHSAGVANTAHKLAQLLGFSPLECKMMLIAGYLHDLGKLAIDNKVLEKPAKLNEDEFNEMRSHTYYTYKLLDTIPQFETIKKWAAYHHERLDGTGYPFKIDGDSLPLGSRIMAVADVFTAITENRPYRMGLDDEKAMSILGDMAAKNAIDGNVVNTLFDHFQEINALREDAQAAASAKYDAYFADQGMR